MQNAYRMCPTSKRIRLRPTLLVKQRTSEVECAYCSLHQFTALILTILGTLSLKESILSRISWHPQAPHFPMPRSAYKDTCSSRKRPSTPDRQSVPVWTTTKSTPVDYGFFFCPICATAKPPPSANQPCSGS